MASSGALATSNQYVKYRIDVSAESGNIAGNYTPVTVSVFVYRTNTGYTTYGTGTIWCKINGTTYSAGITSSQKITSSGITLFSKKVNIPHNTDGTKKLSVTAWLEIPGASLSSAEQGFSTALTTIPRASTISSVEGNVIGEQITVNIQRASSNFTHQVWYKIGSSGWFDEKTGHTTSCSFTVDMEKCKYITNSTSEILSLCVRTYSGNTQIGSDYYNYSYKIHVPESVVPEISSVTVTEVAEGVADKFAAFVQNVSKLKVVTEASGALGSEIASYSVAVQGVSYSGKEIDTNVIGVSGTVPIKVTVKDSRGRTAVMTKNIMVTEYSSPTITKFSVMRAKSNGTEDAEGEYASCDMIFHVSPVLDKNDKTYKIEYQKGDNGTWQTIKSGSVYAYDGTFISSAAVLSSDYAYTVRLTISDYFTSVSAEISIGTGAPLLDFRYTGKGLGIGKVSEEDSLEIAMMVKFYKQVKLEKEDGTTIDLLEKLATLDSMLDYIVEQGSNDYGTYIKWHSGKLEMFGEVKIANLAINSGTNFFNSVQQTITFPVESIEEVNIDILFASTSGAFASCARSGMKSAAYWLYNTTKITVSGTTHWRAVGKWI